MTNGHQSPVPVVGAPPDAPLPPWGYLATFGWVLLAHVLSTLGGIAAVVAFRPASLSTLANFDEALKDAALFSLSTIVATPVLIGVLIWAARERRWSGRDYLALHWPNRPMAFFALGCVVVLLPALDAVSYLIGQPIIPPFQTDIYSNAQSVGALPLLWLAVVVAAPVGEEAVFRGFLFRGWIRSQRGVIPGILIIAALFASMHLQYNLYGIFQVFCLGLLFTWIRWRSGSVLLTMVLHFLANTYAMLQTVVAIHWLS